MPILDNIHERIHKTLKEILAELKRLREDLK